MNRSLYTLCNAIKKILIELKPQADGFSFLILTGKTLQGKRTLLRQSQMQHIITETEENTAIFYNQHGIIVELSEAWLHHSKTLLQHTLKQLNRCYRGISISGILLCVDINELTSLEPIELSKNIKSQSELLKRFKVSLGYQADLGIIFTKLDTIAGFSEFYQNEHPTELNKPLGFSLNKSSNKEKLVINFKQQFDLFCQSLSQQVLHKIHPVRSDVKRTLIREFPLQVASLRLGLQSLVEAISPHIFHVQSLFFTSAEQGGFSQDQLNKKIHVEYALTVQDKFPLSTNYRAFFIEGALLSFQMQTKQYDYYLNRFSFKSKSIVTVVAVVIFGILVQQHIKSTQLLDEASKEWIAYDTMATQKNSEIAALYHLTNATAILQKIHNGLLPFDNLKTIKTQLEVSKTKHFNEIFLPNIVREIEQVLTDNKSSYGARFQALKIYVMLGDAKRFQSEVVTQWFKKQWESNSDVASYQQKLTLLNQALKLPLQPAPINMQIINDTRNYLNALPANYLYYSVAKNFFPIEKKSIEFKGFALADKEIPRYFTKQGFHDLLPKFPEIAQKISAENWVLDKPSPANLSSLIEQAYCYDYSLWWKNFMQKSFPLHAQNYQDSIHLIQLLRQFSTIPALTAFIQEQTSPEVNQSSLFNQQIAGQFTELNLIGDSAMNPFMNTLNEMEKFITTISIVNDQGQTAFTLTKSRFQGDKLNNPLNNLFSQTEQLPAPLSSWAKQIATDIWSVLINDTKKYINAEWKAIVYKDYIDNIANRFPFEVSQTEEEVNINNFNHFFGSKGVLNTFTEQFIKPFLDTSEAQWKPKTIDNYLLPFSSDTINELIRANVITNMFFTANKEDSHIEYSLQKSDLDPVVASLSLKIGDVTIEDTQTNNSFTRLQWPAANVNLTLKSIDGNEYSINEKGIWAFFKLLQKINVETDPDDNAKLQILFEANGSSGRYILTAQNEVNPFTPGILNGFHLKDTIT